MKGDKLSIFVGSSSEAVPVMNKIAVLLEGVGFSVKLWSEPDAFILGKSIFANLDEMSDKVDAAMFIFSDDDKTWYKDGVRGSPRDNVIFEHGFFAGKLGLNKSIIVRCNEPKIPSDLAGIVYAKYDESELHTLKDKLKHWKDDNWKNSTNKSCKIPNAQKKQSVESRHGTSPDDGVPNTTVVPSIEIVPISEGEYRGVKDRKIIKIKSFGISSKLITQDVYFSVMGDNPSHFIGGRLPVENVTFLDAVNFCNALSVKDGYSKVYTASGGNVFWNQDVKGYRLPREAEWEYTLGYDIVDIRENLDLLAWYKDNSGRKTHAVGLKKENMYGIFDMLGNVWEWCFDGAKGEKVVRGGASEDSSIVFANRERAFRKEVSEFTRDNYLGFRVILQERMEDEGHGEKSFVDHDGRYN